MKATGIATEDNCAVPVAAARDGDGGKACLTGTRTGYVSDGARKHTITST